MLIFNKASVTIEPMKTKLGFVSNSSSTSFLIFTKNTDREFIVEQIKKVFKITKNPMLADLAESMFNILEEKNWEWNSHNERNQDHDYQYRYEYKRPTVDELTESTIESFKNKGHKAKLKKLFRTKEYSIYRGSLESNGNQIERLLCQAVIHHIKDDFVFYKDNSY